MENFFEKEGHRGCRGLMPENTIAAFQKAIELGVSTIELDVVISMDKKVIVSHEAFFNHEITTKPDGSYFEESQETIFNIYKMKLDEIQAFDVGLKKHPRFPQQKKIKAQKPTLEEVIDFAEAYSQQLAIASMKYNIEIKCEPETDAIFHPEPSQFIDLVMDVILKKNIANRVTLQSFDKRPLQYLRKNYPTIIIAYLYEGAEKKTLREQVAELGFQPNIYSPDYQLLNQELINECKMQRVKIIPWTVNELEKMKELKEMGVDGIITDYPDLFKTLFSEE